MSEELKPCPFCGDKNVGQVANARYCENCGAQGPEDPFAIEGTDEDRWNTRADGWISVEERLPEVPNNIGGVLVLVTSLPDDIDICLATYTKILEMEGREGFWYHQQKLSPTHWQPLPDRPKNND